MGIVRLASMSAASSRALNTVAALGDAPEDGHFCMDRPRVASRNHRQARFGKNAVKPLRQRSGFQPNSLEAIGVVRKHLQESFGLTRHPRFPHDLARIIHDADARFLDRHIESDKIGHAALLLLMLEAAYADLVSPCQSRLNAPQQK